MPPLQRSEIMSRIRGKDTTPEREIRLRLWRAGLRYRLHHRIGRCRPDLVFPGPRVAVFVDGCFWHGCPEHYVPPRSSRPYWEKKLRENVERDSRQTLKLEADGWRVVRVWEHEAGIDPDETAERIAAVVRNDASPPQNSQRVIRVGFVDKAGEIEDRHIVDLRTLEAIGCVRRPRLTRKQ